MMSSENDEAIPGTSTGAMAAETSSSSVTQPQLRNSAEELLNNIMEDKAGSLHPSEEQLEVITCSDPQADPVSGDGRQEVTADDDLETDTLDVEPSTSFPRCYGMMDIRQGNDARGAVNYYDSLAANGRRQPKPPHPRENSGLRGLRNIGNTCFLNSILQCLSNTEPLLEFVLSSRRFIVNQNSSMKGELFMSFARLIHDIWCATKTNEVDPTLLKERIQKFCPTFRGACQHDAQELLRFLLEGLHNDLNRVTKKPDLKPLETPTDLPDEEKCRLAWEWNLKFDNSQITDIFLGQLKSTLTCLTCGHRSVTFDPFWDLSISIPQPTRGISFVSLQDCLNQFTQEETLTDAEMPKCEKCQRQHPSKKRFNIQAFPDVLVIQLKRFTKDERGKLHTVVKFPLENLNLGVYADYTVNNCSYNLFGICNHFGTAYAGHYIAYAKHPYSKEWHCYDDGRVTSCDATDVEAVEPYLLFYELSVASKCLMDR